MHIRLHRKQLIPVAIVALTLLMVVLYAPEKELNVGGEPLTSFEKRTELVTDQDAYFLLNGKYDQTSEQVTKDGSVRVDEYVGTRGAGYTITSYRTESNGSKWRKIENFGAETERASDWVQIIKPDQVMVASTTPKR